jgi:hypothetical protein
VSGLPDGYPLQDEAAEVADELELHRANLGACGAMDELHAEITRHKTVAAPRYDAMRVRIVGLSGCASGAARAELDSLMDGIDATEEGRDWALGRARNLGDARYVADFYAAGVAELLDRMVVVSTQQAGCYE